MIKKILLAFLIMAIAIGVCACGNKVRNDNSEGEINQENQGGQSDEFFPVYAEPYDYMANDLTAYIKLGEYKGISVSKKSSVLTDENFDNEVDALLAEYAYYEKITDRTVSEGDTVVADYSGYKDGEAVEGMTASETELVASSNSGYIEGFAEAFIGRTPGEEFSFDITFPEDYFKKDLAGREFTFVCTVHYINGDTRIYPELTDEFVKEKFGFSNVDEFLISYRGSIEKQYKYSAELEMLSALWSEIIDKSEVLQYPEQEVERIHSEMRITYEKYAESYGTDYDTFLKDYVNMTDADIMELCKSYVKEDLIMYQLIKEYDLLLSDEEYAKDLEEYTQYYGTSTEELFANYGEESVRTTLLWAKLMREILSDSVIVE